MDQQQATNPTTNFVLTGSALGLVSIDDTVAKFSLNPKQELVVRIVLQHFTKYRAGENPPQLLMAVLGEPGVGKSVVATVISWHFAQYNATDLLFISTFTGKAAVHVQERTLHSALSVFQFFDQDSNSCKKPSANAVQSLQS